MTPAALETVEEQGQHDPYQTFVFIPSSMAKVARWHVMRVVLAPLVHVFWSYSVFFFKALSSMIWLTLLSKVPLGLGG
jgi:uncharacterized membrane protein